MNQFGKLVLFVFFMNYFIGTKHELQSTNNITYGNITYGNMTVINVPLNDYNYYNQSQNYDQNYDQSQNENYNQNYIKNYCYTINNTEKGYFQGLLNIIQVLFCRYFDVFQTCYLRSINIIYYLVTDYFLVFNRLFFNAFGQVVHLIQSIVISNYILAYYLFITVFNPTNVAMISIVLMFKMFIDSLPLVILNNRNRINAN